MALPDVISAVADVCTGLALADQVLTEPPPKLPDDRVFVVYADPGDANLNANQGGAGRAVYHADDDIIVNWFLRIARDRMTEAYPEALSVLVATRDALFAAIKNGALNGTIFAFNGIRTDLFGPLTYWEADTAFGFQLAVAVRHGSESAT